MPDPFNKAKMTGDTHPPEVESDLPLEQGSAPGTESGRDQKSPRGVKRAGLLKNDDGATAGGDETAREAGRGSGGNPAG
ncbi:MAG TPA: hypothetical protein VKD22_08545 [Ramlibacter sp.]|nr:hypothetical protein [Ramlibacter sp.]